MIFIHLLQFARYISSKWHCAAFFEFAIFRYLYRSLYCFDSRFLYCIFFVLLRDYRIADDCFVGRSTKLINNKRKFEKKLKQNALHYCKLN